MIDPILSLAYLVCPLLDYEAVGFVKRVMVTPAVNPGLFEFAAQMKLS